MKILIIHKNKNLTIEKELRQKFKDIDITFAWKNNLKKSYFKNIDLVISIGGDGTFLSASHFIENQLILGVNENYEKSEGALTSIKLHKLEEKILKILKGKYKIKKYQREKIIIHKKKNCTITEQALNETYIGNINPHHSSNYIIQIKNKQEKQRSSGILITTGTGSTAWYKAMNENPFKRTKKQLRFKIRELFRGRIYKPKIEKGKIRQNQKIIIISKMRHGLVAIDSIRIYNMGEGEKVEISLGKPLKTIQ
jgi:NAD+ kinase